MATKLFLNNQAAASLRIKRYWLDKGLVYAFLGGSLVWQKNGSRPLAKSIGAGANPKLLVSKFGSALGLGANYGGSTADFVSGGTFYPPVSGFCSIVAHYYANSTGGGGFGRIFVEDATNITEMVYLDGNRLVFYKYSNAANGVWESPASSLATGRWQSFGVTHDQRTIGVVPFLYLDGSIVTTSTVTNPQGAYLTNPFTPVFGNRPSDVARCWDGMLGPILRFDGILTAADHRQLDLDPLTIFETIDEIEFYRAASSVNGSSSGNLSTLSLTSPTGSSTGDSSIIVPFSDTLDFTLPTISGTGGASCSGSLDALDLTAPTGSAVATGDATANGNLSVLSLTPPIGISSGDGTALGYFTDELDFTPITGNAFSSVTATGDISSLSLTAPTGEAINGVIASGDLAELFLTTIAGDGFGYATANGGLSILQLENPVGIAIGSAVANGNVSPLNLSAPTGSASGVNQHDASASGDLSSLFLSAPLGHAAELAVVEDDSEYILVYSKGSGIRYVPVTPGARKILSTM